MTISRLRRTIEDEVVSNTREAIQAYIESLNKHNEPVPLPMTQEIIEV
jgi:predicted RNase H-like HicB family nuclease